MPAIDPSTDIGKIRLRIGDWRDIQTLTDSVIQSALDDCENNLPRAASLCANYILGILSSRTHRKLASLETWGNEQFEQYVKFLQMTLLNPNMMSYAPIPYSGMTNEAHPLIEFVEEWNASYG